MPNISNAHLKLQLLQIVAAVRRREALATRARLAGTMRVTPQYLGQVFGANGHGKISREQLAGFISAFRDQGIALEPAWLLEDSFETFATRFRFPERITWQDLALLDSGPPFPRWCRPFAAPRTENESPIVMERFRVGDAFFVELDMSGVAQSEDGVSQHAMVFWWDAMGWTCIGAPAWIEADETPGYLRWPAEGYVRHDEPVGSHRVLFLLSRQPSNPFAQFQYGMKGQELARCSDDLCATLLLEHVAVHSSWVVLQHE